MQDIYSKDKPSCAGLMCLPLDDNKRGTFVRVRRHKPRVVYSIHQPVPCQEYEEEGVSVTSQSGKALALLGQACLYARGSAYTPYLEAHVEYCFNRLAGHPKPDDIKAEFSLAEFAAHHHQWKKDITEYALPTAEEPL